MAAMKIDEDTRRRLRDKLSFLIEFGNEEDILRWAKVWNPRITREQLKRLAKLFRDVQRDRAHSPRSH